MTGLLIKIKHRFPALWRAVEWINGKAMRLRYPRLTATAAGMAAKTKAEGCRFSLLYKSDLPELHRFLMSLPESSVVHFNPHAFTLPALRRLHGSGSFVMFGVREGDTLVGYHFLRCFATGRCFHGLVVGSKAQGRGIGAAMWGLGARIADASGLAMYATISEHNHASLSSCARGCDMTVADRLPGSYLLIRCRPKNSNPTP